ncbi:hypothetical protein [uncultured Winogradskyella sp.]|uniref:hypothetical protein n=1 Tax=uncultured Winogradskyella sp. TaxID=395353 RepID=UPI0026332A93|nr:hypothetical protein [uncultured Winogradskyella sp.]
MKPQSALNIAKTNLKLRLMAGLTGFKTIETIDIPKVITKFPKTKDDWCSVDIPQLDNVSSCIYKGCKNSVFDPHLHKKRREHLAVMNEGGKLTLYVKDYGTYVLEYPNAIVIPEGVVHACEFNTYTVLMIFWHPRFRKSWDAEFESSDDKIK